MNKTIDRICILVTMATFWIAFILLSSLTVLCELILLWKAIERSRNSENKTTEKCAVSYLFVYKRFKVRLFTAQVLLIFYLLLRRKIVFKSWLYNHADKILRWWMKCSERKTKEKNHVTILNYIWLAGDFARLENRALFDSFR